VSPARLAARMAKWMQGNGDSRLRAFCNPRLPAWTHGEAGSLVCEVSADRFHRKSRSPLFHNSSHNASPHHSLLSAITYLLVQ